MEYGLRRYEAAQRLFWFLFFIVSLAVACPAAKLFQGNSAPSQGSASALQPEALKSASFWAQTHWMQQGPFGNTLVYLISVAVLFLVGRVLWLVVQFGGKSYVKSLLTENVGRQSGSTVTPMDGSKINLERLFPAQLLLTKMNKVPLQLAFHPFKRLRLMLSNPDRAHSSEGLIEKERRIVETDWQILWSSWTPFRWLVWSLPFVAMAQSVWMVYDRLHPALTGQKEVQDVLGPMLGSLLPLVQAVVIAVFFSLVSGLLRRVENLYLSNVDSLLYDQLLSKLPFQSSDTLILLETLQRYFQEVTFALKRLEAVMPDNKDAFARKS